MLRNSEEKYKNHSYCGYTINFSRRIRQHNGEIKGGAKATSRSNCWQFMFLITGFKTNHNALSCEWKLKHPDGKKIKGKEYAGINGRVKTLNEVLKLNKWTDKCDILNNTCEYNVYVKNEIYQRLDIANIPNNIKINCIESFVDVVNI